MKAKQVRFHQAVQVGATILSSVDSTKHKANLLGPIDVLPGAVTFRFRPNVKDEPIAILVPMANCPFLILEDEEKPKSGAKKD